MTWSCQTSTIRTATLPRPSLSSMHVSFLGQSIIVYLYFSLCSWNPFCKEWFTKIQNKFTKVDFKQITFTQSPITAVIVTSWIQRWPLSASAAVLESIGTFKVVIALKRCKSIFKTWNYYIFNQLSFIGNFFKCIFQKVLISRHGNMRDTVQVKWVQEIAISFAFYVSFHFEQIY